MGGEQAPRSSKLARLSTDQTVTGDLSAATPLMLGLGLGLGLSSGGSGRKAAFTFMQMQELEQQALIYKYMAAGLPVPLHLVLPIWKSVAASASSGRHCSPPVVGGGSLCFDYRNMMEPEPGRCRRTDGKKWRCSRDVVPDHKYCERHVHRGRNRSRKPVDARGAAAKSSTNGIQLMPAAHRPNSGDGAEKMSTSPAMLFSPGSGLRASAAACSTAGYS